MLRILVLEYNSWSTRTPTYTRELSTCIHTRNRESSYLLSSESCLFNGIDTRTRHTPT